MCDALRAKIFEDYVHLFISAADIARVGISSVIPFHSRLVYPGYCRDS